MKKMMLLIVTLIFVVSFSLIGCEKEALETTEEAGETEEEAETEEAVGLTKAPEEYEIAMVFKLIGIPWSDSIEVGMEKFAEDTGVNAYMVGPETPDPVAQVAMVEDLIAKGVDAILVVPLDPASMEASFKKAAEAGILTFTHEADNQANVVYDLEAFSNAEFGAFQMDLMAEWMNNEGKWGACVGSLSQTTHNQWADAAIAQAEELYPDMELVADRFEVGTDPQEIYDKVNEIFKTYPDIKAFLGLSTDMAIECQIVQEKGLTGDVGIFGSTLPSAIGNYVESGECIAFQFWVPEYASYALAMTAWNVLQGKEITEGMDLGVPGYESITLHKSSAGTDVISGQAWVNVTMDNLDEWIDEETGDYKL